MTCKRGYSGPGSVLSCTLPPCPHCPSLLPLRSQSAWAFEPLSPRSSLHWGNPAPKAGSSWLHPPATWIQTLETAAWQPGQAPEIQQAPHQSALDAPPRHPAVLPGLNADNPPGLPWSKGEWKKSSPDACRCSPNPRWWKATSPLSNNNYHLLSAPHMPCTWVTPLHVHNLGSTQCTLLSSPHFIDEEIEVLRGFMIFFSELAQYGSTEKNEFSVGLNVHH